MDDMVREDIVRVALTYRKFLQSEPFRGRCAVHRHLFRAISDAYQRHHNIIQTAAQSIDLLKPFEVRQDWYLASDAIPAYIKNCIALL